MYVYVVFEEKGSLTEMREDSLTTTTTSAPCTSQVKNYIVLYIISGNIHFFFIYLFI